MQMPTESIEKLTETTPEKKICESCGKEFSCGAEIGKCWCFAVEVKAEILTKLRGDFKNCLCESCLENFRKQ